MRKGVFHLLITICTLYNANSQCLAPLGAESVLGENPVEKINEVFKFDYKIKADIEFTMNGGAERIEMDYYVNSADGSMLFPSGPMGFFNTNFGSYQNNRGKIDGAIWLANGQMITYFLDKSDGSKRAVTRQTTQTANDKFGNDYLSMMRFFNSSTELAEHPEPMPSHIQWKNPTEGYKGEVIESYTGLKNTVEIYFDSTPTPIKTSTVMVGFMVGVMKDAVHKNCNRLAVFNKVNIGGDDSGEYLQAELRSMLPSGITFDASDYKPTFLGGDAGTDFKGKMSDFEGRMMDLISRKEALKTRRKRCSLSVCLDRIDAELERVEEEIDQLNCEIAKAMGVEDKMDDCH